MMQATTAGGRSGEDSRRALVVTAESGLADILRDVLRERGFFVTRAGSSDSAMSRLAQETFDLVVIEQDAEGVIDAAALTRSLRHDRTNPSRRAWVLVLDRDLVPERLYRLRDAGVSAILTGVFTVARIQRRLDAMDRDRRQFVDSPKYVGPDRRFRGDFYPPGADRRSAARGRQRTAAAADGPEAAESPA